MADYYAHDCTVVPLITLYAGCPLANEVELKKTKYSRVLILSYKDSRILKKG